jgi:hypothetical protein
MERILTAVVFYTLLLLLVLSSCQTKDRDGSNSHSQVSESEVKEVICNCPMLSKSSMVFNFKNNHKVIACSATDSSFKDSIFSNLKLNHCNFSLPISHEKGNSNTKVYWANDTLTLDIIRFSDSINSKVIYTKEKLFLAGDSITTYVEASEEIHEMSRDEIKKVVLEYQKSSSLYPESAMALAKRMLVAALNGNNEMGQGLLNFEKKMGNMGGIYGRQLREYKEMYLIYLGGI